MQDFLIFAPMRYIIALITLLVVACDEPVEKDQVTVEPAEEKRDLVLDSLNQQILNSPDEPGNYTSRALHFRKLGNDVAAMNDVDRALRADSMIAQAYHIKGNILFDQQDFPAALEAYQKSVELDPKFEDALLDLAYMNSLLGDFELAIKHINDALRENEYLPRAYYMKGQIYKQTGDTALAVSSYQTVTEIDPENYDAFVALALLYSQRKNDLAIEYFNTALSIKPDNTEALYGKAMFLQESANGDTAMYNRAFDIYRNILDADPSNAAAAFNQGYIYLEYLAPEDETAYQKAADWFTRAVEIYPMYYQAFYNRGLCHESMDMLDRAEKDYRKALAIQPDYEPAARALERVIESR